MARGGSHRPDAARRARPGPQTRWWACGARAPASVAAWSCSSRVRRVLTRAAASCTRSPRRRRSSGTLCLASDPSLRAAGAACELALRLFGMERPTRPAQPALPRATAPIPSGLRRVQPAGLPVEAAAAAGFVPELASCARCARCSRAVAAGLSVRGGRGRGDLCRLWRRRRLRAGWSGARLHAAVVEARCASCRREPDAASRSRDRNARIPCPCAIACRLRGIRRLSQEARTPADSERAVSTTVAKSGSTTSPRVVRPARAARRQGSEHRRDDPDRPARSASRPASRSRPKPLCVAYMAAGGSAPDGPRLVQVDEAVARSRSRRRPSASVTARTPRRRPRLRPPGCSPDAGDARLRAQPGPQRPVGTGSDRSGPATSASAGTRTGGSSRCSAMWSPAALTARCSSRPSRDRKEGRAGQLSTPSWTPATCAPWSADFKRSLRGPHRAGVSRRSARPAAPGDRSRVRLLGRVPRRPVPAPQPYSPTTGHGGQRAADGASRQQGTHSGSGVAFSRDENTVLPEPPAATSSENAQGEDIVSGVSKDAATCRTVASSPLRGP